MGRNTHACSAAVAALSIALVFLFAPYLPAAEDDGPEAVEAEGAAAAATSDAPSTESAPRTLDERVTEVETRLNRATSDAATEGGTVQRIGEDVAELQRDSRERRRDVDRSLRWMRPVLIAAACLAAVLAVVGGLAWRELERAAAGASTGAKDGGEATEPAGVEDDTKIDHTRDVRDGMLATPEFVASMTRLVDAVTAASAEMRTGLVAMREERSAEEAVDGVREAEDIPDPIQELRDRYEEGGGLALVGGGAYERLNRALVYTGAWRHSASGQQGVVGLCQEVEDYLEDELRRLRAVAPMPTMRPAEDGADGSSAVEHARAELGAHQRRCERGYAPAGGGALGEHVRHVMTLMLHSEYVTPGRVPDQFTQIAGVLGARTFAPTPGDPLADARHEQVGREGNSQYSVDDVVRVESLGAETGDGSIIVRARVVVNAGPHGR